MPRELSPARQEGLGGSTLQHATGTGIQMVTFVYRFRAKSGQGDSLNEILCGQLPNVPQSTGGCTRIELFRDERDPLNFLLVEDWTSIEVHDAQAEALPADALAPIFDRVAGKMECTYMKSVLRV